MPGTSMAVYTSSGTGDMLHASSPGKSQARRPHLVAPLRQLAHMQRAFEAPLLAAPLGGEDHHPRLARGLHRFRLQQKTWQKWRGCECKGAGGRRRRFRRRQRLRAHLGQGAPHAGSHGRRIAFGGLQEGGEALRRCRQAGRVPFRLLPRSPQRRPAPAARSAGSSPARCP